MKTFFLSITLALCLFFQPVDAQKLPTRISFRQNEHTINVAKFDYDAQNRIKTVLDSANDRLELKYALTYDNEDRIIEIVVSKADGQIDNKTDGFIGVYYFGDMAIRKDNRTVDNFKMEQPKEIIYKLDNNKRILQERFNNVRNEYSYSGSELASVASYNNGELVFTNNNPYASPFKNVKGNYSVIHSMLTSNVITYIVNIAMKTPGNFVITTDVEKGGKEHPEVIKITAAPKGTQQSKTSVMTIEYGK